MSNTTFVESQSADPKERAIARRVMRLLNDPTLERQQRIDLVRQAQRELIKHRRQLQEARALAQRARTTPLPRGYRAVSVQVRGGRVEVGAASQGSFTWVDAGPAPEGVGSNLPPRPLQLGLQAQPTQRTDPLASRRRELQRGQI